MSYSSRMILLGTFVLLLQFVQVPSVSADEEPAESAKVVQGAKVVKGAKVVEGKVVDDAGKPVADAGVRIVTNEEVIKTHTGDDGTFSVNLSPHKNLWRLILLASDPTGERLGLHTFANARKGDFEAATIELRPSRELTGKVVDADDKPLANVFIGAVANFTKVNETRSSDNGEFSLRVPNDVVLSSVVAYAPDYGLDYFLYRRKDGLKDNPFPLAYDHAKPLEFRLNGNRKVKIHVKDVEGKPLAGASVAPWYFEKPRKGGDLNSGLDDFNTTTDANGDATIFVPEDVSTSVTVWVRLDGYHSPERWVYDPNEDKRDLVATLGKMVTLSGRVTSSVNKPLEGIQVFVNGAGYGFDGFNGVATTDAEGNYRLKVNPNQFYHLVPVGMKKSTSPKAFVVRRADVSDVDFKLAPAARIHGRVTMGPTKQPAEAQPLQLYLRTKAYYELDEKDRLPNPKNSNSAIAPYIVRSVVTNAKGEFEFYAGPGSYYIIGPRNIKPPEFELTGAVADHLVDLHSDGPARIKTRGAVVLQGNPKERVAEAVISGVAHQARIQRLTAVSDEKGLFEAQRGFAPMRVFARSKDWKLAGFIDIQADDPFVLIPVSPTADAIGKLVDPKGEPITNKIIDYGVHFKYSDETFSTLFGGSVTTDENGDFKLTGLVVGEEYTVQVAIALGPEGRPRSWRSAGAVTAAKAGEFSIGKRKFDAKRR